MKGRINNKLGEIQISSDVIAMYAGMTAVECFGIVGMAAGFQTQRRRLSTIYF